MVIPRYFYFEIKWEVLSNSAWCKSLVSCCQRSRMCWRVTLPMWLLAILINIKNVVKQICQMNFFKGKQLRLSELIAQQQPNGLDCGAVTMAFAQDCYMVLPHQRNFNKSKLRRHLLMCLEQRKLAPFPQ